MLFRDSSGTYNLHKVTTVGNIQLFADRQMFIHNNNNSVSVPEQQEQSQTKSVSKLDTMSIF